MRQRVTERMEERSSTFNPSDYEYDDPEENPADLDRFYGVLEGKVQQVITGYSNLLMLDAKGGLGKTHNVRRVLKEELQPEQFTHLKGYTTPIELYKSLWKAREEGHILFLDDMSGVTNKQKALDMLKSATDTQGEENWVEYKTSRDIEHPYYPDKNLVQKFCFRGRIIMSFNETPDNAHFNALKDRGTYYQLDFSYDERIDLIKEIAKLDEFSDLSVEKQQETAEWVEAVTDRSMEVSIRTFEEVCQNRLFDEEQDSKVGWEQMSLEVFDIDYEKYLIIRLRRDSNKSVEEQRAYFKKETGRSDSHYYNLLNEIVSSGQVEP